MGQLQYNEAATIKWDSFKITGQLQYNGAASLKKERD